jgi:lipid A 4'-phosphatase
MAYMKLVSARVILVCFAVSSLLLLVFPAIDIAVSRTFFEGRFYSQGQWWVQALHHGVSVFLYASSGLVLAVYAFNKVAKAALWGIDGKKVLYLLLVLVVGAGLLVNVGLKDNFGRARPRNIQEFGGTRQFTPAFVVGHECQKNCSFASGDAAGAFFSLSLAMAFGRRRATFLASAAFGGAVSFARMASGAHFLSDVVVSFFVMLIVADVLYHYMLLPQAGGEPASNPVMVGVGPD